jgi:hypothetical protein
MTIYWKASGVKSASIMPYPSEEKAFSFGTGLTVAAKSAIGKHVDVTMGAQGLAFLLTVIAQAYPEAIRKLAAELGSYEKPEAWKPHDFALDRRLREAAMEGIAREYKEKP